VAALQIIADVADAILFHIAGFRDIVRAGRLCKSLYEAGKYVRTVLYVYRASEYEKQPMPKSWQETAQDLLSKRCVARLRVEIEPELQCKSVRKEEQPLWLSNPLQLKKWVPSTGKTLQHLCIIDYGQQAIMKTSSILEILSRYCEFSISYVASVLVLLWKCFSSCIARKFKLHSQLFPTPLVSIANPNTWTCIEHSFTLLLLLFFWFGSQARDWRQLI
jgi:hypothetical protein